MVNTKTESGRTMTKKRVSSVLSFLTGLALVGPSVLYAQATNSTIVEDIFAPFIDHIALDQSFPEKTPVEIQSTVSDDQSIQGVVLFFRSGEGSESYMKIPMQSDGENRYTALIPGPRVVSPLVEYYIQASDISGNTAYRGSASSPLRISVGNSPQRSMKRPESALNTSLDEDETEESQSGRSSLKPWYKKWWVWGIGVAVIVGAASAGSDGGGGGTGPSHGGLQVTW